MTIQQNTVDTAKDAIEFVFSECDRFRKLMAGGTIHDWAARMSKADMNSTLRLPGREIICGAAATRRLYRLAARALADSDAAGTVKTERVYDALNRHAGKLLAEAQKQPADAEYDAVLQAAMKEAKAARSDQNHFIPCRLMTATKPEIFTIGPVTFRTIELFNRHMQPHYAVYVDDDPPERREHSERLLAQARHYYDGFGWIGEVKILNCDPETSKKRAEMAVTAALDVLHVLFGAYHTDRMAVGGPRMEDDCRAHFHLDGKGVLQTMISRNVVSALGFYDGWTDYFERDDFVFLLRAVNKAIAPLVNPSAQCPLGSRFLEAAGWFGEAVREESNAVRINKAINALEFAFTTGERRRFSKRLCRRAAAVCFELRGNKTLADIAQEFEQAYDLRSDLVHGSRPRFDPLVEERCDGVLQLIENALCAVLGFYEAQGFLDRPTTNEERARAFDRHVAWMAEAESRKTAKAV